MSEEKWKIRRLSKEDDRLAVSRVYEESWKSAYQGIVPQAYLDSIPAGRWAGNLDQTDLRHMVLLVDGLIAGISSFGPSRFAALPDWGEVVSLYLLPAYTRKGYGKSLLKAAVDELGKMGFSDMFLWVLEENHPARRFYEKCGFRQSEVRLQQNIGGRELQEIQYRFRMGPDKT